MKIMLIDGFNLFYRNFHKLLETHPETAEPIGGVLGTLKSLHSILRKQKPDHLIIIWDGDQAGLRRRSIDPMYKGRTSKSRIHTVYIGGKPSEGGIAEDVDNQDYQLEGLLKAISKTPIHSISVNYYEADDIIAKLSKDILLAVNEELNEVPIEVNILSSDRDYLQLLGTDWNLDNDLRRLKIISPKTEITYTKSNFSENYDGLLPENYQYFKILDGDPSDKIKGMKGWGETTAKKLLPFLKNEVIESPEDFFDKIKKIIKETEDFNETVKKKGDKLKIPNKYNLLLESKKEFMSKHKLTQLTATNISSKGLAELREELENSFKEFEGREFNYFKFKSFLTKNGIASSHFYDGLDNFCNILVAYSNRLKSNLSILKKIYNIKDEN